MPADEFFRFFLNANTFSFSSIPKYRKLLHTPPRTLCTNHRQTEASPRIAAFQLFAWVSREKNESNQIPSFGGDAWSDYFCLARGRGLRRRNYSQWYYPRSTRGKNNQRGNSKRCYAVSLPFYGDASHVSICDLRQVPSNLRYAKL